MRLLHTSELPPRFPDPARVVRESRLGRAFHFGFALLLVGGAWGGAATLVVLKIADGLPEAINGLFAYFLVPAALIFGLLVLPVLTASWTRSNWLLQLQEDGLLIKFRSDYNHELPQPHPVVVELPSSEILWARSTREWMRSTSLSSESSWSRVQTLDLKLGLDAEALAHLKGALDTEIGFRPGPGYTLHHHYPVRLEGDVLRVQFRSFLRPRLPTLLARLAECVAIEPPLRLRRDLGGVGEGVDPDAAVLELAQRGQQLAAIRLARRSYGLSLAAARELVEQLLTER